MVRELRPNRSMETIFINTKNSKTNKLHEFPLNLSQRSDLKISNKHVALQKSYIYYTWRNTRQHCENNKFKIIALMWVDKFDLPDSSYSVS